ncbi:MAG: ACT domain-containing protein [Actinobacteria bacterium]|nr:ACT domain-containing protein [Actinomycetota bacterium]
MYFSLRISLPDRPGMLGAMATALSDGGANIVALDVIDREEGEAIDDLIVEAPGGLAEALRRSAEDVPGVIVEAIQPMDAWRDPVTPMELAAELVEGEPGQVIGKLVTGLPVALWSTWAFVLRAGYPIPGVLAATPGAPSLDNVDTPWMPIDSPRRFAHAMWMPPAWRMGRLGYQAAAAPLGDQDTALLLVRRIGPRFRPSELRQVGLIARLAAAAERGVAAV